MTAANDRRHARARDLRATYFTTPRPVYELYDLEADPSELNNLSGKPELAAVERELRVALAEKMILDFDYLPLPTSDGGASTTRAKKGKALGYQWPDLLSLGRAGWHDPEAGRLYRRQRGQHAGAFGYRRPLEPGDARGQWRSALQ